MSKRRQEMPQFGSFPHQRFWGIFVAGFLLSCIIFLSGVWTVVSSLQIIAPGVEIAGTKVGGKNDKEAKALLEARVGKPPEAQVELSIENKRFATPSADLGMRYDIDGAIAKAMAVGRGERGFDNFVRVVDTTLIGEKIPLSITFDEVPVKGWVASVAAQIDTVGASPSVALKTSGNANTLVVKPGTFGREVDKNALIAAIMTQRSLPLHILGIPAHDTPPLSESEQEIVRRRAEVFIGKILYFAVDDQEYILNDTKMIGFLALPAWYNSEEIGKEVGIWKDRVTRDPQEPNIVVEGTKVVSFTPPLYGRTINAEETVERVKSQMQKFEGLGALTASETDEGTEAVPVQVPISRVDPQKKLSELNNLGINERIGFAESYFYHSIPGRVHNVALTANRIHLTVIPPDGVFSFNTALGEVSQATGYKQAYVIQAGRTILGDGGGVCQGSTTVFRTALNAGLPIVSRRGHSYRVSYYEQNAPPGLDATVYSPSVDFKFKNDTPGYILLTTKVDTANYHLIVELWGTSDGRKAELSEYKIWDKVPARATVYQEDPSLPVGTTKQVDWSAPGAKASFRYTVTRGDRTIIDETYKTVYKPWAAVYLVGTAGR